MHLQNHVNDIRRVENNHHRNERNRLRPNEINQLQNVRNAGLRAEDNLNRNAARQAENNLNPNVENAIRWVENNHLQNERDRHRLYIKAFTGSFLNRKANVNFLMYVNVVKPINHGSPCFKICGQIFHCVGNLRLDQDIPPIYS